MSVVIVSNVMSKESVPSECMSKTDIAFLVCGFIRSHFNIDEIPMEIIDFIRNDWFINGISYKQTLYALRNQRCSIGVYDYNIGIWRTAVYMKHWEHNQSIMIRYEDLTSKTLITNKFFVLTKFPTNAVKINDKKFAPTLGLLNHSHLSRETVDEWKKTNKDKQKANNMSMHYQRVMRPSNSEHINLHDDEDPFLEEATYNLI